MIYYNRIQGKETKKESIIIGSVRSLIVMELKNGREKRFSEITRAVAKKDNVVNRELKGLIARDLVIKTSSGYKLDMSKEYNLNYIKQLEIALPGDSEIYEIKTALDVPDKKVSSSSPDFMASILPCKVENANHILKYIKINIVGEKIDNYDANENGNDTLTGEEFVEIAHVINKILGKRSLQDVRNQVEKNPELEKDDPLFFHKKFYDLRAQTWKKPLKLIISYTPDAANEDDLIFLAKHCGA